MPPRPRTDRTATRRYAIMFALLMTTTALAGCNFRDFYNQEGTIRIHFLPMRVANGSAMNDFQKVTVALGGVTLRQVGSIDPKSTSFRQPVIVDVVDKADTRTQLAEYKTNLRATGSVTIRFDIVEAIEASGKSMKICHEGVPIKNSEYPCFFVPETFAYTLNKAFAPPRGGAVDVSYAFVIKWAEQSGRREYFLSTPLDLIKIEHHD